MSSLEEYIKSCIKLGFSKSQIVEALKKYNVSEDLINDAFKKVDLKRNLKIGLTASIVFILLFVGAFYPSFVGFVVNNGQSVFAENVNLNVSSNETVVWDKQNSGLLTYLYANGKVIGNGSAKVYLKYNGTRYLIIDSSILQKRSGGGLITGLVVDDTLVNDSQILPDESLPVEDVPVVSSELSGLVVGDVVSNDTIVNQEVIIENITDNVVITSEVNDSIINDSLVEINQTVINDTNIIDDELPIILDNNTESVSFLENNSEIIVPEIIVNDSIVELNNSVVVDSNISIEEVVNDTLVNDSMINQSVDLVVRTFSDICVDTCSLTGLDSESFELEFITDSGTSILLETFTYQIKERMIFNNSFNSTINESLNIISNVSLNDSVLFMNATINGSVEIDKPVLWKQRIDKNKTRNIILPKETFNITVKDKSTRILINNNTVLVDDYNLEKEIDLAKKEKSRIEKQFVKDSKDSKKKLNKLNSTSVDKKIFDLQKKKNKNSTIIFDNNITLTFDDYNILSNVSNESQFVELEYYTEGPLKDEKVSSEFFKEVTISSDIHYQNIKAYTDIVETRKDMITLNWLTDSGKVKVDNINYVDSNGNGLVDRIEWIVPHLSNQTYEVNISVLNLHSYPTIGGEWRVEFITTGKQNLSITAENGTVYDRDIAFSSLKCGNNLLTPTVNNGKIFYADYECNETGYFTVIELRQGPHVQKFLFGDAVAYAYNFAGNLPKNINLHGKLTNSTGGLINTTVNMTFSLYTTSSGGSADWTETQNYINVSEGIYTAILGSVTPITVNFSVPYYLGIKINTDAEMDPRINMTSTPYTYNAFYAQQSLESFDLTCTDCIGNTEINTTGVFNIDGNLNATHNITLADSIIGLDNKARITITDTGVVINLE